MAILNISLTDKISYSLVDNSTITIKVSGGSFSSPYYNFTDENSTSIDILNYGFMRGRTYIFEADGINGNHPFRIRLNNSWTNTISGSSGSITITIPSDYKPWTYSPVQDSFYYQCTNHSSMRGNLTILAKLLTGTTNDGEYDFYYGDINVTVDGDFGTVSIYCYSHGYMGGENLLVYNINNLDLLYINDETPVFQDITKSSQLGCFYPSGKQYEFTKMMTGFGYLVNNTTNTDITWTVPNVTPSAGNIQIESGNGGYQNDMLVGSDTLAFTFKVNSSTSSNITEIDTLSTSSGGLSDPTYTNDQPSIVTNSDFNIYLDNVTETTAAVWMHSKNSNINSQSPNLHIPALYFIIKNNLGPINRTKLTWYNFDETNTLDIYNEKKTTYDNWPTSNYYQFLVFDGYTGEPYDHPETPEDPGSEFNFETNSQTSPYTMSAQEGNGDYQCRLLSLSTDVRKELENDTPFILGYIKYTE